MSTPNREFRAAVGEVAQAAAMLEMVTGIITWGLVGLEQRVARIVLPNSMDAMLNLIKEMLPLRVTDEELQGRVRRWAGDVRAAYSKRGAILHSLWMGDGGAGPHARFDIRKMRDEIEYQTAADLLAFAAELRTLAESRAGEFMTDLIAAAPGPWSAGPTPTTGAVADLQPAQPPSG